MPNRFVVSFGNGRVLVRKVTSREFPVVPIARILLGQDLFPIGNRLAPNVICCQIS